MSHMKSEGRGDGLRRVTADEIRDWLTRKIAAVAGVEPHEIDTATPFTALGLTSREAVTLSGELEEWLQVELSPTIVYDHPTIGLVADYLTSLQQKPRSPVVGAAASAPDASEPIAVIGLGCRFPGAQDPDQFWRLLIEGMDGVSEVPRDRWDVDEFYDSTPGAQGKMYTRRGGFLEQIDQFDPEFFRISPREAARMDPQQRLLLEVAWEALENAGVAATSLAGTPTGVFVGISSVDYAQLQLLYEEPERHIDAYSGTGIAHSIAANRLSYALDLQGPSIAVDTACSSSLVAVHLACQSLRSGESELAVVGGVNALLLPEVSVGFSLARMLAPDGRCKTFDATADGYVRGEGCGVLVLKPLSSARRDGDRVLAVIRGTAVNQDGRTNGLTAPNGFAQQAVVERALRQAGLTADRIGYIEAHGTGTTLGDYIEVKALVSVLGERRGPEHRCLLGSVKANIGHLEAASGIAGLIKALLCLQHGEVPPQLHLQNINPHIALEKSPLVIPTERTPWPAGDEPRLAAISSFGFGGTNAHVLLEEAPAREEAARNEVERPLHLLCLTARGSDSLRALAGRYDDFLAGEQDESLADICHSANAGRAGFEHRLAAVAESVGSLRERLRAYAEGQDKIEGLIQGRARGQRPPTTAFLFTGQGAQYAGMGRELYETQPLFRATLDRCAKLFRPHLEEPLLQVLYPAPGAASSIDETVNTQPALFAIEYALAELWRSWGITPDILLGHSVGEYVAACVAGVFSLEDGVRLVAERARLMQALPRVGAMAVIFGGETMVRDAVSRVAEGVSIAAVNGPLNTVITGERASVQKVSEELAAVGVASRTLQVSHAFHSPLMEPMLDDFERVARGVTFSAPRLSIVSNLTGRLHEPGYIPDAEYWRRHARGEVLFAPGVVTLHEQGCETYLEVGPQPVLLGMGKQCVPAGSGLWLPTLRRDRPDWQLLLQSLSELFMHGAAVDWQGFDRGYRRRRVSLPTYPFRRKRYWLDPDPKHERRAAKGRPAGFAPSSTQHPLLGQRLPAACPVFEIQLGTKTHPFLGDHRVQGAIILPGTAYVEMALAAAKESLGGESFALREIAFRKPLLFDSEMTRTVQVIIGPPEEGGANSFQIFSRDEDEGQGGWTLHATGAVQRAAQNKMAGSLVGIEPESPAAGYTEEMSADHLYAALEREGLDYGRAFRGVERIWRRAGEALGRVRVTDETTAEAVRYILHPAILDSCFHVLASFAEDGGAKGGDRLYLPASIDSVHVYGPLSSPLWTRARLRPAETDDLTLVADLQVCDETGNVLVEVEGLRLQALSQRAGGAGAEKLNDWMYEVYWRPGALRADASAVGDEDGSADGGWLILADRSGVGEQVCALLTARGGECVLAYEGEEFAADGPRQFRLNASRPEEARRLVDAWLASTARSCRGIVHLWNLDTALSVETTISTLDASRSASCVSTLHLVQALAGAGPQTAPRLFLVTRGAQAVGETTGSLSLAQSPLWGLGRVVALEQPELRCTNIDLSAEVTPGEAGLLTNELLSGDREDQIALRGGGRYVARLAPAESPSESSDEGVPAGVLKAPAGRPFRLEIPSPGVLDNLALLPSARRRPGSGEVEIQVFATGVNFRDVMKTLGIYPSAPGDPLWLGDECAGRVVEVGEGVEGVRVGDEVLAVAPASFGSFVTTSAEFVAPIPASLSFAEAATIPITFLTAYYALRHLAHLGRGERVLIHAAAGGVGLAAVQIARHVGAEIYATAGSDEKREFLRTLGVEHVMDSRSLEFAEEVRAITGGRGVDVVLNSLAGEAITKSLAILGDYGRFLEIGKRDIYQNSKLGMRPFQKNLSFFAIDMDRLMRQRPAYVGSLLREIMRHFTEGVFRPLPLREFTVEEAVAAFRHLAQGKNIGKVVVTQPVRESGGADEAASAAPSIRPDATYLITGGLGGLGLEVARWLVRSGARHLVLMSRGGASVAAAAALEGLRSAGASVVLASANVADAGHVARALAMIDETMPPLRGVVHAAGVLDDGVLLQLTAERFASVMLPKVNGAWNLHAQTQERPLDFFVLFSSVASVLGSPGQGNYSAANAYLDALAHHRRALDRPALSINWGPWADVGMAARAARGERSPRQSVGSIGVEDGLKVFERLLFSDAAQVCVLPTNGAQWRELHSLTGMPLLSELVGPMRAPRPEAAGGVNRAALLAAEPGARRQVVEQFLQQEIARALDYKDAALETSTPLNALGLDSLSAIELKNRIEGAFGVNVPMITFLQGATISSLSDQLLELSGTDSTVAAAGTAGTTNGAEEDAAQLLSKIDELSDAEVDALLGDLLTHEKLDDIGERRNL